MGNEAKLLIWELKHWFLNHSTQYITWDSVLISGIKLTGLVKDEEVSVSFFSGILSINLLARFMISVNSFGKISADTLNIPHLVCIEFSWSIFSRPI